MSRLALAAFASSFLAVAATYDSQPGAVELSGSTGVLVAPAGLGNHPLFGGGLYVSANKYLAFGTDVFYSQLMDKSAYGVHATADVYGLTGNTRFSIPTGTRVTPYAIGGLGLVRSGSRATMLGSELTSAANNSLAFNAGGGLKVAVKPSFGVRGEARLFYIRNSGTAAIVSVGAFYQFGGE